MPKHTMSMYDVIFPERKVCVVCWRDPEGLKGEEIVEEVYNQMMDWAESYQETDEKYSPFANLLKKYKDFVVVNRVKKVNRRNSNLMKQDRISLWRQCMGYQIIAIVRRKFNNQPGLK